MQDSDNANNKQHDRSGNQKHGNAIAPSAWLGVLGWVVLIAIGILAYVAHYYVNEHSASIKFFTEAFLSAMVLVVIVVQAAIYYKQTGIMERQLRATEKAAQAADKALQISERPYLAITAFKVTPIPFEIGKPIAYSARIQNTGRTPAYDVWGGIYLTISEAEITDETGLDYPEFSHPVSRSPIAAGGHQTRRRTTPNLRLTPFDVERLNDGRLFLYVYGVEYYKDSFTPDIHRLAHCWQYNRLTERMEVSPFHNESD